MKFYLSSCLPCDLFSIAEVKKIAVMRREQVVLIFANREKKINVLCGKTCEHEWAVIPSVNIIIEWIIKKRTCYHEVLLVHNHPELPWHGEIIPSEADIISTEFLKWQLALLGINLSDHVIISGHKKLSLKEYNLNDKEYLKVNGFEIKRFLYCFLAQAAVFSHRYSSTINSIVNYLENNLDKIRDYYEKPAFLRIFYPKPQDKQFKAKISQLKTTDEIIKKLINLLLAIRDDKNIIITPEKIIPYGLELQKKIIAGTA
ncbi:MAG: hypothetical protein H0Z40_06955 [Desulfotomaculum sp.]|nr:hypothetical protein [Desulfotomaculum sp.]